MMYLELFIDKISLSPYCFGYGEGINKTALEKWNSDMTDENYCRFYGRSDCHIYTIQTDEYRFTTCNMQGPFGPQGDNCDKVYNYYKTKVAIGDSGHNHDGGAQLGYVTGVQRWTVPTTGIYTVYANGASGGKGFDNFVQSKADQIRALVKLTKGEQLFILVGQMGVSGCKENTLQCAALNHRNRRHALPSSTNYEDNFGFVNNGINSRRYDDHSVAYHGGRSYTAQNREKQQTRNVPAPHARPADHPINEIMMSSSSSPSKAQSLSSSSSQSSGVPSAS
jgi:hypothetical protein